MSHAPERTEKNCLNCGETVIGRYCHACGQENIVPKETFWHLLTHFFYDITHFDSNFFSTLKYLLFKPGFLSKEYLRGRRMSYLNPVRMYVFTSAIFFLVFFLITKPENFVHWNNTAPIAREERISLIKDLETEYKKGEADTSVLLAQINLLKDTTHVVTSADLATVEQKSKSNPDLLNNADKPKKPDSWLDRLVRKKFHLDTSSEKDAAAATKEWVELFLHKLPYLLFISLPLFALILKLIYIRRKKFYYADHAIFSIHHYILSFILLLFCFLLGTLYDASGWGVFRYMLLIFLLVLWPAHLYIAMLNFYGQGWFKTFLKFILLNLLGLIVLVVLFAIFFLLTLLLP